MTVTNPRVADHPVDAMFLNRWSPRAFDPVEIPVETLLTMLEAGRWAASSYNAQPWRFLWARRATPHWTPFLDLLVPGNRAWAEHASALVFIASKSTMRPPGADADAASYTHSFDAGTASGYIALQASLLGWYAHGMVGFDKERAARDLRVPPDHRVEAAYAIGRLGDKSRLPEPLQAREQPNARLPLAQLAFEGGFAG